jgi:hypothetical protein
MSVDNATLKPRAVIPASRLGDFLPVKRSQREAWIRSGIIRVFRYPGTRVRFCYADDVAALQATATAVVEDKP